MPNKDGLRFDVGWGCHYVDLIKERIPDYKLSGEDERALRLAFGWRTADGHPAISSLDYRLQRVTEPE